MSMVTILESVYKDAKCGLDYNSPFSLVISLILAAQCTDARVNVICPILLSKYPNALSLSNANIYDIQKIIYPCGFYKNKAKVLKDVVKKLLMTLMEKFLILWMNWFLFLELVESLQILYCRSVLIKLLELLLILT